ncbi:hypothetical protein LguiB_001518 [Lonicera macranthoides]
MATATATRIFQTQNNINNNNNGEDSDMNILNNKSREEIQSAIAKAVELRALHAALLQGNNSPATASVRSPSCASPFPLHNSHLSAHDYPVFTPSYEDEPLPGYQQILLENQNFPGNWDEYSQGGGNEENQSSWTDLPSESHNLDSHICPIDDQKSVTGSCTNHITSVHRASPGTDYTRSRRNSLGDFKSLSSTCNKCKPAIISTETENPSKNFKYSNIVVPLTDSHSSIQTQPKSRGLNFSWLFPKLKKKHKYENSPNMPESEVSSHKDFGGVSIESLKRDLVEANESRDAAMVEVSEMKSSLGELKKKLEYLESYCEELKKALMQAVQGKESKFQENPGKFPWRGKTVEGSEENVLPVTSEVMVEGFLQIVSEARLSVKQFCKTLIGQVEESDNTLMDNLNFLLLPYKLSLNSKYSKAVLYHLEAIINQALYQDFENCIFQKNGAPKFLDPQEERRAHFTSFVALRNLSWNEVLRKGTKYYSEEFSKFCDQKMSCIITTLNWTRPWPEQLLQAFFVAAKCIWLLHLLAFSFEPTVGILRVEENRGFDGHFMEDLFIDKQRSNGPSRVKVMVVPGFYVQGRVLRCKVLCRYKSLA